MKKILYVNILVMTMCFVFVSCDKDEGRETSIMTPIVRISQHGSCDVLEWDLVEGAEKYNVLESESRAELEKINQPTFNSNIGGYYSAYAPIYGTYLSLCDKTPIYKNRVMYYVVFAIGKFGNYQKSQIILYKYPAK